MKSCKIGASAWYNWTRVVPRHLINCFFYDRLQFLLKFYISSKLTLEREIFLHIRSIDLVWKSLSMNLWVCIMYQQPNAAWYASPNVCFSAIIFKAKLSADRYIPFRIKLSTNVNSQWYFIWTSFNHQSHTSVAFL